MRQAKVIYKGEEAGLLSQQANGSFTFSYTTQWFEDSSKPAISLTLPKTQQVYHSGHLFPFFYNMLPEGINKEVVCKSHRIDRDDAFGLLLVSTQHDTIGAIRLKTPKGNETT